MHSPLNNPAKHRDRRSLPIKSWRTRPPARPRRLSPLQKPHVVAPVAFAPLQATVLFGNSGRQPAPTFALLVPKIFSLEDWNNGTAVADIEKFKAECLALPMSNQGVRITFPTTGFNTFQIKYNGTQESLRDVQKLSVSPNLVGGKEVVAFKGCFVYQSSGQIHRTSFCYFYQAKVSDVAHLNYCTVGQAAD
jgi:hypothetical protein